MEKSTISMHSFVLVLLVSIFVSVVEGGEKNHRYEKGEQMTLWVNRVGPYHNPQETYPYYRLPFCKPDMATDYRKKKQGMGDILAGNDLRDSTYSIKFLENQMKMVTCKVKLDTENSKMFQQAIRENYWYNMYLDDLPVWGMVGKLMEGDKEQIAQYVEKGIPDNIGNQGNDMGNLEPMIFGHRGFKILYNDDRVIEVNLLSGNPQKLQLGKEIEFTFEVSWEPTDTKFENRFERYLDNKFFEHQIHWFSILNSFMMVIFLCGLVALILLRTLRNDFAKYTREEQDEEDGIKLLHNGQSHSSASLEESGWKQVHGDVFRAPDHLVLFSALYGTGLQIAALVTLVILFAIAGPLHGDVYEERGEMVKSIIVAYAVTSLVAGYGSGSYYRQYFFTPRAEASSQWQKCMIATVLLLPSIIIAVISYLNTVALYYDTINTIPFMVIVKMALLWLFVSLPLSVIGCMLGRHWNGRGSFPCRVNSIVRPIPIGPWYSRPAALILITGILPFGSIFIEIYFIFTSFWNYKFYYVYGFMLLVYIILNIVLVCATIVAVYFALNAENYKWQWISFLASGSTALYVFLYSVYYFHVKTEMFGFLQINFYFGYMGLFCIALFLLCGTVGVLGSTLFVKHIYRNIKVD